MVGAGSAQETKEIELKLEFDPADAAKIKSHPLLAANRLGAPEQQELVSIYFDTPDRALSKERRVLARARVSRPLSPDHQGDA